ncbi:MAG: sensor histidine kinase, partial [Betaproteobacteria bacterium]
SSPTPSAAHPGTEPPHPPRLRDWINPPGLGLAIGVGLAAAVLISPVFVTPVWVLMARTLFIALALLAVYTAVERCPEARLPFGWPRWLTALLALPLAAVLATLVVYLVAVRGDIVSLATQADRISGVLITAFAATLFGLPIALVAQVRAREQGERAERLAFELERSGLEPPALDARLALLTAQIQPHFLFNTLANGQALVEAGSPRAPALLGSLIEYLRAAMPRLEAAEPRLADELKLVRAYLALMKMRMPDRLDWAVDVDEALAGQRFPPMALLTLVENAVRHGIDPQEDGGHIQVTGRRTAEGAVLTVADDGAGMAEHAQPGTGLRNLRERLAAFFGAQARLDLAEQSPRGLRATLHWSLPGPAP